MASSWLDLTDIGNDRPPEPRAERGHGGGAGEGPAAEIVETRSYGEIANQIGKPSASRAVGAANGRNPISIIAPCHRVIGSGGQLTGFAGGLEAKQYLLELEG